MSAPTSSISSARQIENLIARYSHLVDEGDFAERGALLDSKSPDS